MGNMEKRRDYVIKRLKEEGFVVQLYESYGTKSKYIKLDYGICNTIRISDHRGKEHLKYKFNLLSNINVNVWHKDKGFWRGYYPTKDVDKMIEDIIETRERKIRKYGRTYYKFLMKEAVEKGKDKKGFWQKAKEV